MSTMPYGLWPSPFTPSSMSGSLRLSDVQWSTDGATLVWLEGRSALNVLVAQEECDAPRDLTSSHNVRAMVGYGGGDYTAGASTVVYLHTDGRLYTKPLRNGQPRALTPAFGHAASPTLSPDEQFLVYVHSYEDVDVLAIVDTEGKQWPVKIAEGADFYMQPVWHPSGQWLAWIEWDHPNMPWDGTRLCMQEMQGMKPVGEPVTLHGGVETPLFQPAFSPDGQHLSVIQMGADSDSILLWKTNGEDKPVAEQFLETARGGILAAAGWGQGMRTCEWHPDSRHLYFHRNEQGFGSLWCLSLESGAAEKVETPEGLEWFSQLTINPVDGRLAFLASGPAIPTRVYAGQPGAWQIHRYSGELPLAEEDVSKPQPLSWESENGTTIYGLYYPPTHPTFEGKGLPPVVVGAHGGPTSQRVAAWSPSAAFFTSRGYGFLEVNYRGSFGYGKDYVDALKGRWGDYDVEDTVGGARHLVEAGLADPERLIVMGGSAGGYTVLNCLVRHPGVFKAGVCLFGVSNLFTILSDTHKFESHYPDLLVGTLPEARQKFHDWSPVFHAHRIKDSLAIFQGSEDKVVPPDQSDTVVAALRANRIPHHYTIFEGEGHGWRKKETIEQYYKELLSFLRQHVLFAS